MPEKKEEKKDEKVEAKKEPSSRVEKKVKAPEPVAPAKPIEKLYSFEQWASRRGIPVHHRGGMRAFVTKINKLRSLAQWDKLFSSY